MIHNHWLSITHHDSEPLAQNSSWTSGCESWWVLLSQWMWVIVCNAVTAVVNHGVLCWGSGCESMWALLGQWVWVMVCNDEPVGVNYVCSTIHTMINSHWYSKTHLDSKSLPQQYTSWLTTTGSVVNYAVLCLSIMVSYIEPVTVNHGLLCYASGCESWWVMLCQRLWIMACYSEPVVVNHDVLLSITHHDSQPLVQHSTPWLTTTGSV
jgi:hypothetical protein